MLLGTVEPRPKAAGMKRKKPDDIGPLKNQSPIFIFRKDMIDRDTEMQLAFNPASKGYWDRVRAEWEALPDDEKVAYEKRSGDSGQEPHTRMEIDQSPNQSPNLRLGDCLGDCLGD